MVGIFLCVWTIGCVDFVLCIKCRIQLCNFPWLHVYIYAWIQTFRPPFPSDNIDIHHVIITLNWLWIFHHHQFCRNSDWLHSFMLVRWSVYTCEFEFVSLAEALIAACAGTVDWLCGWHLSCGPRWPLVGESAVGESESGVICEGTTSLTDREGD